MIEISYCNVYELFNININNDISCPFKFAKKAKKHFEKYIQRDKIKQQCDSIFPEKYYISDISNYLSNFLISDEKYKITDVKIKENKKIMILPYFEKISENVYSVFAMDYIETPSLIIKYKETYISLIEERCLYLSHVLKHKDREYGVLSMSNLFTIENVQRSYNMVRKYMEMCNTLSSRENRMICKDWLYQEISTYMFQVQLLSAESIFAHLNKYKIEEEVFYSCKEKEFQKVVKSFFVEIK